MKNKISWLMSAMLLLISLVGLAQNTPKNLQPQQAARWLETDKNVVVLDVRTPDEYKAGHLKDARNVDFLARDFEKQLAGLDKSKPYLVHCASGGRSSETLPMLQKLGFKNIRHLDGGVQAWEKAGLPVVK